MATLRVTLITGGDDLRPGSWADFIVKLRGEATPLEFRRFTGTGGLGGHTTRRFELTVSRLTDPGQIEFFQVKHVSHEAFPDISADNWNARVVVELLPSAPIRLAATGEHRFDGAHRVLTFHRGVSRSTSDDGEPEEAAA